MQSVINSFVLLKKKRGCLPLIGSLYLVHTKSHAPFLILVVRSLTSASFLWSVIFNLILDLQREKK